MRSLFRSTRTVIGGLGMKQKSTDEPASSLPTEEFDHMAYAGKSGLARGARVHGKSAARQSLTVTSNTSRPTGALVTGIAIGLLVGATAALLFAPQQGSETRRDLRRGLRRVGRRGHDAWDDLRDELRRARRQLLRARRRRQVELEEPEPVET